VNDAQQYYLVWVWDPSVMHVVIIAEFENAVRCTSFQHPQLQQPPYMMSAGAGKMNTSDT